MCGAAKIFEYSYFYIAAFLSVERWHFSKSQKDYLLDRFTGIRYTNIYTSAGIMNNCGGRSMNEISVLIGGKAGDGISNAGMLIARLINQLGYQIYMSVDYPSLIRGGHNFAIIRGADRPIGAYRNQVDFLLALDQQTVDMHKDLCPECAVVTNSDLVRKMPAGQEISVGAILDGEAAPRIMGNSAMIGAFARLAGIPWDIMEAVFNAHMPKAEQNLRVAQRAYEKIRTVRRINLLPHPSLPLLTGNEAIGLGLVSGGLSAYISYPMTPSSTLLHFLAEQAERLGLTVIHPENEIAVILMALGFSYAGRRTAVGTSGGGFCLMTEGLSLAGMAEIPIVIVVSQRTGPSTGLPTYTGQADLHFVLHAGQGEFPRLVIAPADAAEAYQWSSLALNLAWTCQVPAFILADKTLSEGVYSFSDNNTGNERIMEPPRRDRSGSYARYVITPSGISPLAFPGDEGAVVKVNGYAHDMNGITTENAEIVRQMADKRLAKEERLKEETARYRQVNLNGIVHAKTAIICWGTVRNACDEAAAMLGLRVVQPIVLSPFPETQVREALAGVTFLVAVEENATGQLAALCRQYGIVADRTILKYDGRPFSPDELSGRLKEVILQ